MPYTKGKLYEVHRYFLDEDDDKPSRAVNALVPVEGDEDPIYYAQFVTTVQQVNPQNGQVMSVMQRPGEIEMEGVKTLAEAYERHDEFVKKGAKKEEAKFRAEQLKANAMMGRIGGIPPFSGGNTGMRR